MQPPTVVEGVMGQTTQISIMSLKQSKALKPGEASETHWGWWECGFPGLGLSDWSRVCLAQRDPVGCGPALRNRRGITDRQS